MSYWYHGTSLENYKQILKDGFHSGTFFAKELSSALCYGGEYVFSVWFKKDPSTYWEWICKKRIPKSKIVFAHKFQARLLYRNEKEYYILLKDQLKKPYPNKKFCKKCKGSGQLDYYENNKPDIFRNRFKKTEETIKYKICDKCHGYGCY